MKQLYNYLFRFKKLSFKERLAIRSYFKQNKLFKITDVKIFATLMTIGTFMLLIVTALNSKPFFFWLFIAFMIFLWMLILEIMGFYEYSTISFEEGTTLTQKRRFINSDLKTINVLIEYFFGIGNTLKNPVLNVFEFKNGLYLLEYIERIKQDSELSKLILATREITYGEEFNDANEEVQKRVIEEKVLELLVKANEKIKLNEFLTINKHHIRLLNKEYKKLRMSNDESDMVTAIKYKLKADRLSLISKKENEKELSELIDEVFSNENNLNPEYKISDKIKEILGEKSPKLIENTVVNYNSDYFLSKINKVRELVE